MKFQDFYNLSKQWTNLTWTVELSGFESGHAIIFALFVAFTVVDTSSKFQTVIVNASIPVQIFFDNLNNIDKSG